LTIGLAIIEIYAAYVYVLAQRRRSFQLTNRSARCVALRAGTGCALEPWQGYLGIRMTAYWIGRAQTVDPEGLKKYGGLVVEAAKKFPNTVLARAGRYKVLEGPDQFDRYVLLRFPSMEAAERYYNSSEYQHAVRIRQQATKQCEVVIVEGVD
jgi:uncharacterized protein (DUF1330 family)